VQKDAEGVAKMNTNQIDLEFFKPPEQPEPRPWLPWILGVLAAAAILGIGLALMAKLGLFDDSETDPAAEAVAASIALVGSLIGSVVALVGTVLKFSIDDRTARQIALDSARNYQLAVEAARRNEVEVERNQALASEAEQRNSIEAAISAVDLLGDNNEDATETKIGGVLLALGSLGQHDLAVALLEGLWTLEDDSKIHANVGFQVIAQALAHGSAEAQTAASSLVHAHAQELGRDGVHHWPIGTTDWNAELPVNCRLGLVRAARDWMVSLPPPDHLPPSLDFMEPLRVLYNTLDDPLPAMSGTAAVAIGSMVDMLSDGFRMSDGETTLAKSDIVSRLSEVESYDGAAATRKLVEDWLAAV
jgi:hypothetical protein